MCVCMCCWHWCCILCLSCAEDDDLSICSHRNGHPCYAWQSCRKYYKMVNGMHRLFCEPVDVTHDHCLAVGMLSTCTCTLYISVIQYAFYGHHRCCDVIALTPLLEDGAGILRIVDCRISLARRRHMLDGQYPMPLPKSTLRLWHRWQ